MLEKTASGRRRTDCGVSPNKEVARGQSSCEEKLAVLRPSDSPWQVRQRDYRQDAPAEGGIAHPW